MGNPRTVNTLRCIMQRYSPDLVFLSETKLDSARIERILHSLNFDNYISVDSCGASAGLILAWRDGFEERGGCLWRLTGFYGFPKENEKFKSWELLHNLFLEDHEAWVVRGDFNETLWQRERCGGSCREERMMRQFREILSSCQLDELVSKGSRFTWCRGNGDRDPIFERLDRIIGNLGWKNMFPTAVFFVLPRENSDHSPLLLDSDYRSCNREVRRYKPQLFEAMWVRRSDCEGVVKEAWDANGETSSVSVWNKIA
ncbi:uncharacterized protein LOC126681948 [Mercurialis annua]|uniref:uncharacterized protein LOC126681948 n=1 Tax=Mercurialis annua TaxID=3986 RepID=UPI00216100EF|nr:uncharacterized protein LOC126681948 [Mercurialis annua]